MKKFYTLTFSFVCMCIALIFIINHIVCADELSSDKDIRNHYAEAMEDTDYIIFKAKVLEIEYDDTAEKEMFLWKQI